MLQAVTAPIYDGQTNRPRYCPGKTTWEEHNLTPSERSLQRAYSISDLRTLARKRLPRSLFDFIDGGAADERTLNGNTAAFDQWMMMPRVCVNVAERHLRRSILGKEAALPLILSPTGLAGFFWRGGETAAARAAARCGLPFCLSTNSIASLEEVASAVPDSERWFQLYFLRDREWMDQLIKRAADANYRVLCLTVDLPLTGRRERDLRNGFSLPLRPTARALLDVARHPRWALDALRSKIGFGNFKSTPSDGFTTVAQHVASLFDPSADWDAVARIRSIWKGPLAIKGILHPSDAVTAVELGCDAVIVSNHGGRQLDGSPPALTALHAVLAAVGDRTEVILDGGIRRGSDILKAISLGASATASGRAFLWGLAAGGEDGVVRATEILREEMDNGLALIGAPDLGSLTRDHVRHRSEMEVSW